MQLHVFNPDHDMALAANYPAYIAKAAGRRLMSAMAWLPVYYADVGDAVLLPDGSCEPPLQARLLAASRGVRLIGAAEANSLGGEIDQICPWGWNPQIAYKLQKWLPRLSRLLPSDDFLRTVRQFSARSYAAEHVLRPMVEQGGGLFRGEAVACRSREDIEAALRRWTAVVAKEPWSGSGRGLRYLDGSPDAHQRGWLDRVVNTQGCVMIEPHYNKVADLAAEFYISRRGEAYYRGLSIFLTRNGQYQGNILAPMDWQRRYIERWLPFEQYEQAVALLQSILSSAYKGYMGPLGVDMMIVSEDKPRLHPCVEVNLRQTMGHLSLSFHNESSVPMLLNISADGDYHIEQRPYAESNLDGKSYW